MDPAKNKNKNKNETPKREWPESIRERMAQFEARPKTMAKLDAEIEELRKHKERVARSKYLAIEAADVMSETASLHPDLSDPTDPHNDKIARMSVRVERWAAREKEIEEELEKAIAEKAELETKVQEESNKEWTTGKIDPHIHPQSHISYLNTLITLLGENLCTKIKDRQRTRNTNTSTSRDDGKIPTRYQSQESKSTTNSQQHHDMFKIGSSSNVRDVKVCSGDEGEQHDQPEECECEEGVYSECCDEEDETGEDHCYVVESLWCVPFDSCCSSCFCKCCDLVVDWVLGVC